MYDIEWEAYKPDKTKSKHNEGSAATNPAPSQNVDR